MLDKSTVHKAAVRRNERPLLLIDIAVPRDIDPAVVDLYNVQLYDIDSLQMMSELAPENMQNDLARAEGIIERQTEEFRHWWDSLNVVPLITSIREQSEDIRREEVAKTLSKIKGQISVDSEELATYLDSMTGALVKDDKRRGDFLEEQGGLLACLVVGEQAQVRRV